MKSNGLRNIVVFLALMFIFSLTADVLITRYFNAGYLSRSKDSPIAGEIERAVVTGHLSGSVIKVEMENGQKCSVQLAGAVTPFSGKGFDLAYEYAASGLPVGREIFLERAFNSLELKDSEYKIRYVWMKKPGKNPKADEIRDNLFDARIVMDGFGYSIPSWDNSIYGTYIEELGQYALKNRMGLWQEK